MMLLWFAMYQGLGRRLAMLFKEKAVTSFWQTFFFAIPTGLLVAMKVVLVTRAVFFKVSQTQQSLICILFCTVRALLGTSFSQTLEECI